MSDAEPVIRAKEIDMHFGPVQVLYGVNFDCKAGEVHALVGENGAGKSTLMKILAGVHTPTRGEISLNGRPVRWESPFDAQRAGVAMVYQELDLLPELTAAENILLNRWPKNAFGLIDWKEVHKRGQEFLDLVGAGVSASSLVKTLSVPQQQHVMIARALVYDPTVLILDEPTDALSAREIEYLFTLIRKVKDFGKAVIFISHKIDEVKTIADRITVLRDGKVVFSGQANDVTNKDLAELITGRRISEWHAFQEADFNNRRGEPILEVKNLSDGRILSSIDLTCTTGRITVITGLVGAGKSELAKALIGARRVLPTTKIIWRGAPISLRSYSPCIAVRLGIGLVPEDRKEEGLLLEQTAGFNLTLPALRFIKGAHRLLSKVKETNLVNDVMRRLLVRPPIGSMRVSSFSGGNQQKLLLARWFAARCDLLILDEPTRGVDVGARAEIYELLRQTAASGKAILVLTSDLHEAFTIADELYVMKKGRLLHVGKRREVGEEELIALTLGKDEEATK